MFCIALIFIWVVFRTPSPSLFHFDSFEVWFNFRNFNSIRNDFFLIFFYSWRKTLEDLKIPSSEPYLDAALDFFNGLFQNSNEIWFNPKLLKSDIQIQFPGALKTSEMDPTFDLRDSFDFPVVLNWDFD